MKDFENRVVLVTGTTGIGRSHREAFRGRRSNVVACGIDSKATTNCGRTPRRRMTMRVEHCDVSQPHSQALISRNGCAWGGLDVIVNAAASIPSVRRVETRPETWNRCMAVNVGSIFLLAAFRVSGDEEARAGDPSSTFLSAGLCLPARSCGIRRLQGRRP